MLSDQGVTDPERKAVLARQLLWFVDQADKKDYEDWQKQYELEHGFKNLSETTEYKNHVRSAGNFKITYILKKFQIIL